MRLLSLVSAVAIACGPLLAPARGHDLMLADDMPIFSDPIPATGFRRAAVVGCAALTYRTASGIIPASAGCDSQECLVR